MSQDVLHHGASDLLHALPLLLVHALLVLRFHGAYVLKVVSERVGAGRGDMDMKK